MQETYVEYKYLNNIAEAKNVEENITSNNVKKITAYNKKWHTINYRL